MDNQQQSSSTSSTHRQQELIKVEQRYINGKFPEAILKRIILFLNAYDIEQSLKVCYLWYSTCTNETFWMKLFLKEFGPHGTYFNSFVSSADIINSSSSSSNLSADGAQQNSASSPSLSGFNELSGGASASSLGGGENTSGGGSGGGGGGIKKRNAETPDFYKQPQCKWRNAYLYRIHMLNLFKNGNLSITKMYTQPDLQILQMRPAYVKEVYESATYSAVNEDAEEEEGVLKLQLQQNGADSSSPAAATSSLSHSSSSGNKTSQQEELGMVDEQSKTIFDLTVEEDSNKEVWKDCGFHLFDVRLIDDYMCLNCKKYFRHMEKTAVRKNSRHMVAYKLTTARDIHAEHDPSNNLISQWTCAILNKSSEHGQSVTNKSDRIQVSNTMLIEAPVLYNRHHAGWSAGQLMNDARHYPSYGSFYTAWAPACRTGSLEYLELMFEEEVFVCGVDIFETYLPGAVYKVSIFKKDTQEFQTVWLGPACQTKMPKRSRIFSPPLKRTTYKTNVIRIDIDTRGSKLWTEIDCVRLHGYRQLPPNESVSAELEEQKLLNPIPRAKSFKGDGVMNQYDDMVHLVRQGHVEKFPYEHITSTPFDLHHGLLATVITESMYYHISCSLVVTGASSFLRNKIFLEAKYIRDYVIAVKILNNWTVMAIVKQFKMPLQYVIHVWCLRTKKLLKTFEMRECTTNFSDEIAVWELAESAIACIMGKTVCVYDIYHPQITRWRHLGNFDHPNLVTSISMNSELEELCNVVATGCTDGNCRIWSLRTRNCLFTLPHQSPVSDVKLIAGGSMVATCCVGDNCIRFWTLGKTTAECVKIVTAPGSIYSISNKTLNFDGTNFALFAKGTNEFSLCRFADPETGKIGNKQIMFNKYSLMSSEQQHTESCTLL